MKLGVDNFLENHIKQLKGKRVGLLAHGASLTSDLHWTPQVFNDHPDINLVKLFGPEHGVFGTAQDMEGLGHAVEPVTGLPIVSLYGQKLESLKPRPEDLRDIDVLVCDLQDVGTRFYTYIYTMAFCIEACAERRIPVVILDRPNPLGGEVMEGNVLADLKFRSFVGWYSLPVRHGLTIGELANRWNDSEAWNCDLTVIPMEGWERHQYYDQTGLNFVAPSPNMPTLDTAIVYPGGCLIEATQLSEGRGTTKPFEWIGSIYIKAGDLAKELNNLNLPGVYFRPYHFKPGFQKLRGQECKGVQLHVTDRKTYRSFMTGLQMIRMISKMYPNVFKWRAQAYEFVRDIPAIDLLTGGSEFRDNMDDDAWFESWVKSWDSHVTLFKNSVKLLY